MIYTNTLHICPEDRLTLLAASSGQAINTIFNGLLNGASLFPIDVKEEGISTLAEWLIKRQITIYISASPLFRRFTETLTAGLEFPTVRVVRLASQTVFHSDVELYKKRFSPECIFVNGLSSTEANRLCNFFIDKDSQLVTSTVPVGYPVPDKEIMLLDEDGDEVGVNQVGEIVVKSHYLSPGYWANPRLSGDSFQPDPDQGTDECSGLETWAACPLIVAWSTLGEKILR